MHFLPGSLQCILEVYLGSFPLNQISLRLTQQVSVSVIINSNELACWSAHFWLVCKGNEINTCFYMNASVNSKHGMRKVCLVSSWGWGLWFERSWMLSSVHGWLDLEKTQTFRSVKPHPKFGLQISFSELVLKIEQANLAASSTIFLECFELTPACLSKWMEERW